jgi:hypothetical protein
VNTNWRGVTRFAGAHSIIERGEGYEVGLTLDKTGCVLSVDLTAAIVIDAEGRALLPLKTQGARAVVSAPVAEALFLAARYRVPVQAGAREFFVLGVGEMVR